MQVDLSEVKLVIEVRIKQLKQDYKVGLITLKELQVAYRHINHIRESLIFAAK